MNEFMFGDGVWHMGWVWISIIVLFGLLCTAGWFAIVGPKPAGRDDEESSEETLKRRYASGDIDDEAYKRMLDNLKAARSRK